MFIRLLSAALFIIGFAGFVAPFWLGSVKGIETLELPLAAIEDVAVAPDGRIYFALMHLGRVQVYNHGARFIRNVPVENRGGAFCLDIDGSRLTVAMARRDAYDVFDLEGLLLSRDTKITDRRYAEACRPDPHIKSVDWAVSEITLNFADGHRLVFPRQLWHYLALGPFWSWLMLAIALFLWPEWRRGILRQFRGKKET